MGFVLAQLDPLYLEFIFAVAEFFFQYRQRDEPLAPKISTTASAAWRRSASTQMWSARQPCSSVSATARGQR